jgi:hypothetical protein
MLKFNKDTNTLVEVKTGIKQYGSFSYGLKNWSTIQVDSKELWIERKDGTSVVYKNVNGTFGFPTVLS